MRTRAPYWLLPLVLGACLVDRPPPDLGSCADAPERGQSYGEIGIGTCLAGPIDLAFVEEGGETWLAVANANPSENFATGSVVMIDWSSVDLGKRTNLMGDLRAAAQPIDALIAGIGVLERDDGRLLLVSDRLSEGSITVTEDDRALVMDISDPSAIGPWSGGDVLDLREDPGPIAVSNSERMAFVANLNDRSVSVVNTDTTPLSVRDITGRAYVTSSRLRDADNSGTRALARGFVGLANYVPTDTWTFSFLPGTNRLMVPYEGGVLRYTGSDASYVEGSYGIELDPATATFGHTALEDPSFFVDDPVEMWFADGGLLYSTYLVGAADWSTPTLELTGGADDAWDYSVGAPQRLEIELGDVLYYDGRDIDGANPNIGVAALNALGNWSPSVEPVVPLGSFSGLSDPYVMDDNLARTLRMWMTAYTDDGAVIAVAESADGLSWTEPVTVLDADVQAPTVFYRNGRYRMLGSQQTAGGWTPVFSTSFDGLHWTDPTPIDTSLVYDSPQRMALQSRTTAGWRIHGANTGTLPSYLVGGGQYVLDSLGLTFRVRHGHELAPTEVDTDLIGLWPVSRLEMDGLDTVFATAQLNDGSLTSLRFTHTDGEWALDKRGVLEGNQASSPVIVADGSGFRAFYSVENLDGRALFATATSADGQEWTREETDGVGDNPFHQFAAIPHSAEPLAEGGWRVWYSGYDGSRWRIGAADTPDGISYTLVPGDGTDWQLGPGEPGSPDDAGVQHPVTAVIDGVEHLWYAGSPNGTTFDIFHAQRAEGSVIWTRDDDSIPLLFGQARTFSDDGYSSPVVTQTDDGLEILVAGTDGIRASIGSAIGTATRWYPTQRAPTLGDSVVLSTIRGGQNGDVIELNQAIADFTTTGTGVTRLVHDDARGMLYVSQRRGQQAGNYIQVLDVRDDSGSGFADSNAFDLEAVLRMDRNQTASGIRDMVLMPDGERLYVLAENPDALVAIDLSELEDNDIKDVVENSQLGMLPLLRIGTSDPGRPYADEDAGSDTSAPIAGAGLALAPDGKTLLVTHFRDNSLVVFDTSLGAIGEEVRRIPNIGENPWRVIIAPDGQHAVVANYLGDVDDTVVSSTLAVVDIDPESPTYLEVVTWLANR